MKLSVIIPAYNEETTIEDSLERIVDFFRAKNWGFEVIVVDDGSSDTTAERVERMKKQNPEVKIIKNEHRGKGHAIYIGGMEAQGEFLYFCDADLSTPIEEFDKLFSKLREGYDIAIASREGKRATRVGEPLYRHIMGRVFNYMVRLLTVRGVKDTQCGFKLFKVSAVEKIFPSLKLYGEHAKNIKGAAVTAYDVEVLFVAQKRRFKIAEVPVLWKFRNETRVNPIADTWRNFFDVVKVRINDLRGLYD